MSKLRCKTRALTDFKSKSNNSNIKFYDKLRNCILNNFVRYKNLV